MKNNIIFASLLILFLFGCNNNNEQLTIIDGVVLGQTKEQYSALLKEIKIPNRDFYTNFLVLREKDLNNNINFHYTEFFNYDEFRSDDKLIEHFGVFVPEFINNKHLTALKIFLGHTGKVSFINPEIKKTDDAVFFRQDVVTDVLDKVINLYKLKYGSPKLVIKRYGLVEGDYLYENNFKRISFDSNEERFYSWETDYFTITLFYGFNLNAFYKNGFYSTSTNWLYSNSSNEPLSASQKSCFSLPYIKYELNQKGLKRIGLNKMNY